MKKFLALAFAVAMILFVAPTLAHGQVFGNIHRLVFPQIVYGGGWVTTILVTNVSDRPAEFTHGFTAQDGSDLYVPITPGSNGPQLVPTSLYDPGPIAPKGSWLITLTAPLSSPIIVGSMDTTVPIVGGKDTMKVQVTLLYMSDGVHVDGQASVLPVDPSKTFGFQAVHSNQTSNIGFAIVNLNFVPAVVTMRVHNMSGQTISLVNFTVPTHGQVARLITELAPELSTGWSGGLVEFISDQDVACTSLSMNGGVFSTSTTF